jgi:hypothetical protein
MNQEPRRSRDSEEAAPRQTGDERAGVDIPREAHVDTSRDARFDPSGEERAGVDKSRRAALFHDDEARGFRSRWDAIQTGFVDEPRTAVEEADALVAQVVARVVQVFGEQRTTLERQWDRDRDISTEDLRVALTRYRAFFDRLLSV